MVVGSIPEHVCTSERMNERMPGGVHLLIRALTRKFKGKKFLLQCVNERGWYIFSKAVPSALLM